MECIVKAEAKISCAEYREYEFYDMLLRNKKPAKYLFAHYPYILAGILTFLIILCIRGMDSFGQYEYYLIFAALLLIVSPLYRYALLKIGIPDGYTYEVRESTYSYVFLTDQYTFETKRNDTCTKAEFSYDDFTSAVKWENSYYISVGDGRTHIIPACSIIEGTPQLLEALLKEKLGNRYIVVSWFRGKHRRKK